MRKKDILRVGRFVALLGWSVLVGVFMACALVFGGVLVGLAKWLDWCWETSK